MIVKCLQTLYSGFGEVRGTVRLLTHAGSRNVENPSSAVDVGRRPVYLV